MVFLNAFLNFVDVKLYIKGFPALLMYIIILAQEIKFRYASSPSFIKAVVGANTSQRENTLIGKRETKNSTMIKMSIRTTCFLDFKVFIAVRSFFARDFSLSDISCLIMQV
jgi:hypothetical protein